MTEASLRGRMADDQDNNKNNHSDTIDNNDTRKAKKRKFIVDDSQYALRKRPPYLFTKRRRDVYASRKSPFKAQLNVCEKLLDAGEPDIVIHGLGNAIDRACNLALQLQNNYRSTLDIDIKTSTTELIDEFEPKNDELDYQVNVRNNSSIHIRVFRKITIGNLKYVQ